MRTRGSILFGKRDALIRMVRIDASFLGKAGKDQVD